MVGRLILGGLSALLTARYAPSPGWSAARVEADGRLRVAVSGAARAEGDAVTPATLFQAASVSKTANALLLLRLAAEGAVDLDRPLNAQMGDWRLPGRHGDAATPASLLSHTAGAGVQSFAGYPVGAPLPTLRATLDGAVPANNRPVRADRRPGRFRYAGGGTMATQALAEAAGGAPWGALLRRHVLDPLGIDGATSDLEPAGPVAYGHDPRAVPMPGGWLRYPETAAGGLWASPEALTRMGQGILRSLSGAPDALLPRPLAERMLRPVAGGAALGFFVHGGRAWHDGANPGFRCMLMIDPGRGDAMAVMTNGDGGTKAFRAAAEALG